MKRNILIYIFTLFLTLKSFGTHNRAGEITYKQISQFTYQITLVTYTYTKSDADRDSLEIAWGDNTISTIGRISKTGLPDDFQRNVYVATHTYPGSGTYEIFMLDQNRNAGIGNIDGSVNIPFAIKTKLTINPQIGFNNTPILLTQPLDKAAVGRLFIHNPAAWDADGDSLSYKLTTCLGENGEPIPLYRYPQSSNRPIFIDEVTGDLVWDSPVETGNFNVAFYIEEWRNGIKIGQVLRDMQITVINSDNMPPEIVDLNDYCIEAGKNIVFDVLATDADGDNMTLSAYGGPFQMQTNKATFAITDNQPGTIKGRFEWQTICDHVRPTKYQVEFKAEDQNTDVRLVDFEESFITVVAPAPKITQLVPTNNTIHVFWESSNCKGAYLEGYKIYRRIGNSNFSPLNCQTGVPEGYGFKLIAEVNDPNINDYLDSDNGIGLKQGQWYCYRIVAKFSNGSESYSSEEVCQRLERGVPIITNVDVETTSVTDGTIKVAWVKPTEHDVEKYPGPYKYVVSRAEGIWGVNFVQVGEINGIDNTEFLDTRINTTDTAYNYKVEFYSGSQLISPPQTASSIYISVKPNYAMLIDIKRNTPWVDTTYVVYRKADGETDFSEIGITKSTAYEDKNVEVDKQYCYYVKGNGYFSVGGVKEPIINRSQQACETYIDKIPPCKPNLSVSSDCDGEFNILEWKMEDLPCNEDIAGYEVYFAINETEEMQLVSQLDDGTLGRFEHTSDIGPVGCYQIVAYDYFDNKSERSIKVCVDNCPKFILPNVFTPNGDNVNDLYQPLEPFHGIKKVEFRVFDRSGQEIFYTEDPNLNWDGVNNITKQPVSDGIYFYTCTVYENRIGGITDSHQNGFIHVYNESIIIKN